MRDKLARIFWRVKKNKKNDSWNVGLPRNVKKKQKTFPQ